MSSAKGDFDIDFLMGIVHNASNRSNHAASIPQDSDVHSNSSDMWLSAFVKLIPTADEVANMPSAEVWHRGICFCLSYVGITLLFALLLEAVRGVIVSRLDSNLERVPTNANAERSVWCDCFHIRSVGQSSRTVGGSNFNLIRSAPEACSESNNADKDSMRIIGFCWYRCSYAFLCASLVAFAFFHGFLDLSSGMVWELYAPWLLEAMIVHALCACSVFHNAFFESRHEEKGCVQIKSFLFPTVTSVTPMISIRFDTMKDLISAGLYIQHQSVLGYCCACLVGICFIINSLMMFKTMRGTVYMLHSMWPVLEVPRENHDERLTWDTHRSYARHGVAAELLSSHDEESKDYFSRVWLAVAKYINKATRHEVGTGLYYQELPQAACAIIFMVASWEVSSFLVFCVGGAMLRLLLLTFSRPYALAYIAAHEHPWIYASRHDFPIVLRTKISGERPTKHELCIVFLKFITDNVEPADVVTAALRACGDLFTVLHHDNFQDREQVIFICKELSKSSSSDEYVRKQARATLLEMYTPGVIKQLWKSNLNYNPKAEDIEVLNRLIHCTSACEDLKPLLRKHSLLRCPAKHCTPKHGARTLMVVYTDLEPDGIMGVAQLWQWKVERGELSSMPLIIFGAELDDKDLHPVFETKFAVAFLTLGDVDIHVLTPAQVEARAVGPKHKYVLKDHKTSMKTICDRILSFDGDCIHFYIMAPGRGSLGQIFSAFQADQRWPFKGKVRTSLYSSGRIIKNMTSTDLCAIEELANLANKSGYRLVDVSNQLFFGRANQHPWTETFNTFATEQFAAELSKKEAALAAALTIFNDVYNARLVRPDDMIADRDLRSFTPNEKQAWEIAKAAFTKHGVSAFCNQLVNNPALFVNIRNTKKYCVVAFALQGCHSPLCDQLIFLYEWLEGGNPGDLFVEEGRWQVNQETGLSYIDTEDKTGIQAIQPRLRNPRDERLLAQCSKVLEAYFMRHLDSLGDKVKLHGLLNEMAH